MKEIESSDFEGQIEGKYLLDFYADWCAPCIGLKPTLEALEAEQGIPVYKLNIDELPLAAARYGVRNIPTVMLMKDGKPVSQLVGSRKKADYEHLITLA